MTSERPVVDSVDRHILELLRQNARRTLSDIGSQVSLSVPAVKRRIDRLEATGVIKGYTTVLNHKYLGDNLEAVAELRFAGNTPVDAIESLAEQNPEIQAIFTVAGDPDALAWIRVSDVDELKRTIDRIRRTGMVTGTKTLMILGSSMK